VAVPKKLIRWPIRFGTSNPQIRVTRGNAETLTLAVNRGTDYWMTATELVAALQTCLNTHTATDGFAVTLTADGFISISCSGGSFTIAWTHQQTTVDPTIFGFELVDYTSADGSAITAPDQAKGIWQVDQEAVFDSFDIPQVVGKVIATEGGGSRGSKHASTIFHRDIIWELVPAAKIQTRDTPADRPYGTLEYAWVNSLAKGSNFRVYDDSTINTYSTYRFRGESPPIPYERQDEDSIRFFAVKFRMIKV
jgi:hypothetical protein